MLVPGVCGGTMAMILGSMAQIFPGMPIGPELLSCIALAVAGFGVILLLSKKEI